MWENLLVSICSEHINACYNPNLLVFEGTQRKEWFKSQSRKQGSKTTYYMTRTKKANVFRAWSFGEERENMWKPCGGQGPSSSASDVGKETFYLRGKVSTEARYHQKGSMQKRHIHHLARGLPGQGTCIAYGCPPGSWPLYTHSPPHKCSEFLSPVALPYRSRFHEMLNPRGELGLLPWWSTRMCLMLLLEY